MELIKKQLTRITIQLLRPLIRILLRYNVSHAEFVEMARHAYVDVAFHDFALDGKKKTISRAAVITGLSRKDVVRLRNIEDRGNSIERGPLNRAARVMSGWLNDAEFQDSDGHAKSLPIKGEVGSFDSLVKRYSGDISWGAVLDELVRVGAVQITEQYSAMPLSAGYIPRNNDEQKLSIVGDCATDLLETLDHNLQPSQLSPRFQRSVSYNYLTDESTRAFEILAKKKSDELLVDLNAWLAERNCKEGERDNAVVYQRAGLGIYFFNNESGGARYDE